MRPGGQKFYWFWAFLLIPAGKLQANEYIATDIQSLRRGAPVNPNPSFNQRFGGSILRYMESLTEAQCGQNATIVELKERFQSPQSTPSWTETNPSAHEISNYLRQQNTVLLTERIKKNISILGKIEQGLEFNIRLPGQNRTADPADHTPVRYGLVVQEIIPEPDTPALASISSLNPTDLEQAGKARVHWTIGPIQEDTPIVLNRGKQLLEPQPGLRWEFKTKVALAQEFAGIDALSKNLDDLKVSFRQVDGLYELLYFTHHADKRSQWEHHLSLPIWHGMRAAAAVNNAGEHFDAALENIFMSESYDPQLHFRHLPIENKSKLEISHRILNREVLLSAESSAQSFNHISQYSLVWNESF